MGYPLPVAVGVSRGVDLQVVDYAAANLQAKAVGNSVTLEFEQPEQGYLWRVERLVVTATSAASLNCAIYAGYASPGALRDWTQIPAGWSGIAEYPAYLTIPAGVGLVLVCSGTTAGDVITGHVQYQLVLRAAGGGG
jgi:hypothetical protein